MSLRLMLFIILLSACASNSSHTLTYVVDGDTFYVSDVSESIRLLHIDAPELSTPEGVALRDLLIPLLVGQPVTLACDGHDKYDRLLCTIHVNGIDLGQELIDTGWARVWK